MLTWPRGGPGHNKMVYEDQNQRRCRKVQLLILILYFERRVDGGGTTSQTEIETFLGNNPDFKGA